jgi:hypothetical protein
MTGAGARDFRLAINLSSSSSVAPVQEQNGCANTSIVGPVWERSTAVPSGQRAGPAITGPAVPLNEKRAPNPATVAQTEIVVIAATRIPNGDGDGTPLSRILTL